LYLPANFRAVEDARDFFLVDLPVPVENHANRVAILWDFDRDTRPIDVLIALWYRDLKTAVQVLALHEYRGDLTIVIGVPVTDQIKQTIQSAADAALRPNDHWTVRVRCVATRDGTMMRSALAPNDPLQILPETARLGLVVTQ
jgi:hypothetical protein